MDFLSRSAEGDRRAYLKKIVQAAYDLPKSGEVDLTQQLLEDAHERWVADYNEQDHFAHEGRENGRRSPREVLGWITAVRFRPEDLKWAFFSTRFSRKLDALGYATFMRWKLYGEEALAGGEAPCGCRRRP
jgi:hypothetical protein